MKSPPTHLTKGAKPTKGRLITSDEIYRQLYDAIVAHDLLPGAKLTEDVIAESFEVSRTIIRLVLRRLADDGVVDLFPNRGAYVARPQVDETRHMFGARRLLESGIVSALGALSETDLAELDQLVAAEDAARMRGDQKLLLQRSSEFHVFLAGLHRNPVLSNILQELVHRTGLAAAIYQEQPGSGCRTDDHRRLVDLLRAGQPGRAARFMVDHLLKAEQHLNLDAPDGDAPDLRSVLSRIRRTGPSRA